MSLADELLADLEENDNEDLEEALKEDVEIKEEKIDEDVMPMEIDTTQITSIRELAKLRDSSNLKHIVEQIENYSGKIRRSEEIIGPVESDPEYQLIVEANNIAADVDNEIGIKIYSIFFLYCKFVLLQQ